MFIHLASSLPWLESSERISLVIAFENLSCAAFNDFTSSAARTKLLVDKTLWITLINSDLASVGDAYSHEDWKKSTLTMDFWRLLSWIALLILRFFMASVGGAKTCESISRVGGPDSWLANQAIYNVRQKFLKMDNVYRLWGKCLRIGAADDSLTLARPAWASPPDVGRCRSMWMRLWTLPPKPHLSQSIQDWQSIVIRYGNSAWYCIWC